MKNNTNCLWTVPMQELRSKIEKEMEEFENSYKTMEWRQIYNDYYIIGFYEAYFEMLMDEFAEANLRESDILFLNQFENPIGFLYGEWISDSEFAFSHDRGDLCEYIQYVTNK